MILPIYHTLITRVPRYAHELQNLYEHDYNLAFDLSFLDLRLSLLLYTPYTALTFPSALSSS